MASGADANPKADRRTGAWGPRVLLGVLAVAVVVRVYDLDAKSYWLDELYSLATSAGRYPDVSPLVYNRFVPDWPDFTALETARPWPTIWTSMREGTHPPLYLLVLRAWREAFGGDDVIARALSVLCSVLAVLLAWDVGRMLHGQAAGLWAAALMALATPQVHYAQEARPYAMLFLLGMGAMDLLVRIERSPLLATSADRKGLALAIARHAGLGLCLLAMALTHYFSAGALLAVGVYVLARFRGKKLAAGAITLAASAALFLALWGPALWNQRHNTSFGFLDDAGPGNVARSLARADKLPLRYFVDLDAVPLPPVVGTLVLLGLVAAVAWPGKSRVRSGLLPLLWLVLTAGFIVALDLARGTRHVAYIRYTLLAAPGLYLLAPAALARLPGLWGKVAGAAVPGLLVIGCALALPFYYNEPKENWRGLGEAMREGARSSDRFIFAADKPWQAEGLAMGTSRYARDAEASEGGGLPREVLVLTRPATADLMRELRPGERAVLVVGTTPSPPATPEQVEAMVRKWLPTPTTAGGTDAVRGVVVMGHVQFSMAHVVVVRFDAASPSAPPRLEIPGRRTQGPGQIH